MGFWDERRQKREEKQAEKAREREEFEAKIREKVAREEEERKRLVEEFDREREEKRAAKRDARIQARAGDRQAVTPAAVDEVERLRFAVPEIFCVEELFVVRAEVFEKIVARADGDAGHRGVGIARDAVGDLIDRAIAAAGIEPHIFSALGKTARERGRVAD